MRSDDFNDACRELHSKVAELLSTSAPSTAAALVQTSRQVPTGPLQTSRMRGMHVVHQFAPLQHPEP